MRLRNAPIRIAPKVLSSVGVDIECIEAVELARLVGAAEEWSKRQNGRSTGAHAFYCVGEFDAIRQKTACVLHTPSLYGQRRAAPLIEFQPLG